MSARRNTTTGGVLEKMILPALEVEILTLDAISRGSQPTECAWMMVGELDTPDSVFSARSVAMLAAGRFQQLTHLWLFFAPSFSSRSTPPQTVVVP